MAGQIFQVNNEAEYAQICETILTNRQSNLFLISGEMGAGKTSLVKAFVKQLKSKDEASSPTFSIVNEYRTSKGPIYHFDLYRLESIEELLDIGIEEYLYSDRLCFIEWPELLEQLNMESFHKIEIECLHNSSRRINFSEINKTK